MTRAETTERDVNKREQTIIRETRQEVNIVLTTSFLTRPTSLVGPPPSLPLNEESTPDTPFRGSSITVVTAIATATTRWVCHFPSEEEEEEEEAINEVFISSPSTTLAAMT